jgi:hypothetical protein
MLSNTSRMRWYQLVSAVGVLGILAGFTGFGGSAPAAAAEQTEQTEHAPTVTGVPESAEAGPIEVRIPLSEHAESVKVALPEMRCPAATPYVWDMRFQSKADPPVPFPGGLQPEGNADRVVAATWADHLRDDQGLGVALAKGSVLELAGLAPGVPAIFRLYCTGDRGMAVGLGSISQPAPIEIGVAVRQQLQLEPGVTVSSVTGLPRGLALSREGLLTGFLMPSAAGETRAEVRLTNGRATLDRLIFIRTRGKVIEHVTKSWLVPNGGEVKPAGQFCPLDHPWTIARQYHDPVWSPQQVPNGVQAVTHPNVVEVRSRKVTDGEGYSRGLTDITASFRGFAPEAGIHFVLHCTNDANAAGR